MSLEQVPKSGYLSVSSRKEKKILKVYKTTGLFVPSGPWVGSAWAEKQILLFFYLCLSEKLLGPLEALRGLVGQAWDKAVRLLSDHLCSLQGALRPPERKAKCLLLRAHGFLQGHSDGPELVFCVLTYCDDFVKTH